MRGRGRTTFGKRQAVEELIKHCELREKLCNHPFVLIQARYVDNGKEVWGYGISRCSPDDKWDEEVGNKIARYRAVRSIIYKLNGKNPHHPLMG